MHIRKLAVSAAYRADCGEFLCDGRKLLEEARRWSDSIRVVVCTGTPPPLPENVRIVQVPEEVMAALSPAKTPQGILAVCGMMPSPLPESLAGQHYVVLDGIQDPGNVGTLLRTAAAFRMDGLFLLPGCADLYSPRTVRASMGAVFRIPVWRCDLSTLAALLDRSGLPLWGAGLTSDAVDVRTLTGRRLAVAVGSEGQGLSRETLTLCRQIVRIPMDSRCESLNAAQAGTILMWELCRNTL